MKEEGCQVNMDRFTNAHDEVHRIDTSHALIEEEVGVVNKKVQQLQKRNLTIIKDGKKPLVPKSYGQGRGSWGGWYRT